MNARSNDVLVVGGGVVGVCAAYYLARRGLGVTLVEQAEIAAGSSYGNAGLVVPSHSTPLATPGALSSGLKWLLDPESPFYIRPRLDPDLIAWLWKFSLASTAARARQAIPVLHGLHTASLALYDELAAQADFAFDYHRAGLLHVFQTAAGLEHALAEARWVEQAGVSHRLLDPLEICRLEPALRPGLAGGLYYDSDAHLNPAEFVRGLARRAEALGVCLQTQTEALGLELDGRRVSRVRTTRGDFRAGQVVLAAGSWSPRLAREAGLRLPIQAAKGYSITLARPAASPQLPMLLGEARVAVTPLQHVLRFAGTLELAGLDLSISQRRVDAMLRAARRYLHGVDQVDIVEIWRGLRPCAPDGLPILGRPGTLDNVIVATGHAMIGMSLGPITGMLVAQLACGERPDVDLRPMRVERFQ